jgi:hypothetical protein
VRHAAPQWLCSRADVPSWEGYGSLGSRARLIAVFAVAIVALKQKSRSVADRGDNASGGLAGAG